MIFFIMKSMYLGLLKKKMRKCLVKRIKPIAHTCVPEQQRPGTMGRNHGPFLHHVPEPVCLLGILDGTM